MPDQTIKLLLVDDDDQIRRVLAVIFTQMGYNVRTAEDGFAALAQIRIEVPDIILSDLDMPRMSGFELLSVVRRRFPLVRVIAMSGAFSGESIPAGVAANAFYEKGTNPKSLLAWMDRLAHPQQSSLLTNDGAMTPLWISRSGYDSTGAAYVLIACPQCLRAFSSALEERNVSVCHAECPHCLQTIEYAIVQTDLPVSCPALIRPTRSASPEYLAASA